MLHQGFRNYHDAATRAMSEWPRHLATHITASALGSLALWPLFAVLLQSAINLSGSRVISDFDIAGFLLTPLGLLALVVVFAAFIAILVTETAAMMAIDMAERRGAPAGALHAVQFLLRHLPVLVYFGLLLAARTLAILLPAVGLAALISWGLLRAHDINYYLATHPPEFLAAAALVALTLLAAAFMLLRRLLRWSLGLPLILFARIRPTTALARSSHLVRKRRPAILQAFIVWGAMSFGLTALLGSALYALGDVVLPLFEASPGSQAVALGFGVVVWIVSHALLLAFVNATFAVTLNGLALAADPLIMSEAGVPEPSDRRGMRRPIGWALIAGATAFIAAGSAGGAISLIEDLRLENHVQVIAHRGGATAAPENTRAALLQGIADGADWLEIDVQEAADGTVVVIHDRDLMRQAKTPIEVRNLTSDDIAGIDIGSWFAPDFATERLMTLPDALAAAKGRARLLIELKDYGQSQRLEESVMHDIEAAGMAGDIAIMSMSRTMIERMKALRPDWPVGLLTARAFGDMTRMDTNFLAVSTGMARTSLLRSAHDADQAVYVWTVNDAALMSDLIARGFDGLITDNPALAREMIARHETLSPVHRLMLLAGSRLGLTD